MADEKNLTMADAVDQVKKSNQEFKEEVIKKAKGEVDSLKTEIDTYKAEAKKASDEAAKNGATILDMQAEIKKIEAKHSREIVVKAAPGDRKSVLNAVSQMVAEKKDVFDNMATSGSLIFPESVKLETKVGVITSASISGQAYGQYMDWQPGMEPTGQTRFRDLVRTVGSDVDTVYYPRANAIGVTTGSFGKQTTEGAAKAQLDRAYTMITLTLYPFAGYTYVSRQSLRNIPFLQSWLPTSLNEQLMDAEDADFANTLVAAATGTSTTTGITVAVERLIYFIKNQIQAKFYPTAIAIDPTVWAEILVTKPSNYSLPNAVSITPAGRVLVLGVPVYPVNWLTGRRVLMGDFTKAAIVESEGLTFRQSNDVNDNFIKNVVTFLLERVEGLMINRTDAFITAVV